MTASEKSERIAEAKVLISLCYFEMLRYVGGVTWLDHYVDVNETMNFPRITFAETVEKIVGLLNEAINSNLAWKAEKADDGRMTLAGARSCNGQPVRLSTQTPNGIRRQTNIPATEITATNDGKMPQKQAQPFSRKYRDGVNTN